MIVENDVKLFLFWVMYILNETDQNEIRTYLVETEEVYLPYLFFEALKLNLTKHNIFISIVSRLLRKLVQFVMHSLIKTFNSCRPHFFTYSLSTSSSSSKLHLRET